MEDEKGVFFNTDRIGVNSNAQFMTWFASGHPEDQTGASDFGIGSVSVRTSDGAMFSKVTSTDWKIMTQSPTY